MRLSDTMTMAEAGRAIIAYHFSRMLATEAGTAEGRDPEALHDMRVSTRRLRAAFRVFRQTYGTERVAVLDSEVRWLAGLLGRVRDLDVLLEALRAYDERRRRRRDLPLSWVTAEIHAARAGERLVLLEALASPRYLSLKRQLATFLSDSREEPHEARCQPPLRQQAAGSVRRQLRRVRTAGRQAATEKGDALHTLRIAAKRLRYTMEFFRDLFPPELGSAIEVATAVQDHLGAMRDARVQAGRLADLAGAGEHSRDERRALDGFLRYLRKQEKREHEAYEAARPLLTSKPVRRALKALLEAPPPETGPAVKSTCSPA
ncbi:MAG: CHAD domain-containing protein [Anaerolineae bacterium]